MKLEGKVAIVTGAGQGIGREYSKALSREGAKVVVAEIKEETGQAVADEINGLGGDATFAHLDLASEASCLGGRGSGARSSTAASTSWSTTARSTTACAPTPS